jgi:hypothetical protein
MLRKRRILVDSVLPLTRLQNKSYFRDFKQLRAGPPFRRSRFWDLES